MTIDDMLRGMRNRTSFHMPGHKMRFGAGSEFDVTELDMTDDLHQPTGPYCELARKMADAAGAAVSFPLVGGSTRGVQLMLLSTVQAGQSVILPRNAHLSAWSACAIGGLNAISVMPRIDEQMQLASIDAADVCRAIKENPQAKAVLLTRPDYYGRMDDIRGVAQTAHASGMKVLVDEAHGAHLHYAGLESAGDMGADMWVQSLHKTLPALTPCAVLHAADACVEYAVRRLHHMLETSSPSSLMLHSMQTCMDYMQGRTLSDLTDLCQEFLKSLMDDSRFSKTRDFYAQYSVDPTRLVIDVRGTGLSGFEVSAALMEQGVDMEMADAYRIVGIPTVMSTKEDMHKLLHALRTLPTSEQAFYAQSALPEYGASACLPRSAAMSKPVMCRLDKAENRVVCENIGIYPPGIPLCVMGDAVTRGVINAMDKARELGGTLFGVNKEGEIAVMRKHYDCVIFDLDGTLMDTSVGVIKSVQYALDKLNLPSDDISRIRRFIGPPLHESFSQFYGMDDQLTAKAVAFYRERYSQEGVLEYTPFAGMVQLIKDIKASGRKVGIATGKPEVFARVILEKEGLMAYIDKMVTPSLSDTQDNKPKMVRTVMDVCGDNALMVGDRCFDIDGANANGIDSAGVLQGFGGRQELEQCGATYIVMGAQELRDIIL